MSVIRLVVCAGDLGLCHASNQAIWEAFEVGVLTCATVMAPGPWVAEAAALIQEHPSWEVGLQLTLSCPTLGCRFGPIAKTVPSLVTETGTFLPTLPTTASAAHIRRELDAQLERARAWGIEPAFVECAEADQPAVAGALRKLRQQHGLPDRMTACGLEPLPLPEGAGESALLAALQELKPGAYLWSPRPAQDSPETWGLWPYAVTQQKHTEYQALCSAGVRAALRQRGVELVSFRMFGHRPEGGGEMGDVPDAHS